MNKIIFIFLSTILSLTLISCGDSDDSVSSTSSSGTTSTSTSTTTPNACQTEGSTSRNDSLIVTPTSSRHAEQSGGRLLYVDKSALSQYQTDNYLLLDQFDSDSRFTGRYCPVAIGGIPRKNPCDAVDLSKKAPSLRILKIA